MCTKSWCRLSNLLLSFTPGLRQLRHRLQIMADPSQTKSLSQDSDQRWSLLHHHRCLSGGFNSQDLLWNLLVADTCSGELTTSASSKLKTAVAYDAPGLHFNGVCVPISRTRIPRSWSTRSGRPLMGAPLFRCLFTQLRERRAANPCPSERGAMICPGASNVPTPSRMRETETYLVASWVLTEGLTEKARPPKARMERSG